MTRILLVEDDPLVQETYGLLLEKAGYEVTLAADGIAALTQFARASPDLVVTDIVMPEREGLETIRELRKLDQRVPIIAYSGGGFRGADYLTMAAAFGATATLSKPFLTAELLSLIETCLAPPTK